MSLPIFNFFYSWQSYIGGHANRSYIRQKINKYIESKKDIYEITVDEDSRSIPGASDIPDNILKKIANCDIFICDITPVARINTPDGNIRDIPNPNVIFELGFAVRHIGWDRIILVLNTNYGSNDYVPFDISKHKMLCYNKVEGNGNSEISLDFTYPLDSIIENYSDIIAKTNELDYIQHDKLIFDKLMSFRTEREFINSIQNFKGSYRFSRWDQNGWDHFRFFHDYPENKFINSDLNEKLLDLSKSISQLHSDTASFIFTTNDHNWEFEQPDKVYSKEESEQIQQTQLFGLRKLPYPDRGSEEEIRAYDDKSDAEIRSITSACENVIGKYHDFRTIIKRILVI
jgi:hypothetical protein